LIRESYLIEGISGGECRSIFVDWALSLTDHAQVATALEFLVAHYPPKNPGHPMNPVLTEGLQTAPEARRRGGRAARVKD
jgi:hypothetical protein